MSKPWGGRVDSVGRALQVFDDPWTFAVLREAFFGVRRFDDFAAHLEISRNVLTKRLKHLVAEGVLERRQYQNRPDRYEYRLTDRGRDLYPVFLALMRWGDRWLVEPEGVPLVLVHRPCGATTEPHPTCDGCGAPLAARDMDYKPGPGAVPSPTAPGPG